MQVAEYMRDVALHAALGPYGVPLVGADVAVSAYEGDHSGVARGVAVGAGSLGMSYAMLQFLNAVQGPKYAMTYSELHRVLNPARNLVVGSALANPMAIASGGIALGTALYPEVSARTYQGKMTGQPTIGSAGHELIYNPARIKLW